MTALSSSIHCSVTRFRLHAKLARYMQHRPTNTNTFDDKSFAAAGVTVLPIGLLTTGHQLTRTLLACVPYRRRRARPSTDVDALGVNGHLNLLLRADDHINCNKSIGIGYVAGIFCVIKRLID